MKVQTILFATCWLAFGASPLFGQGDSARFASVIACMRAHPERAGAPVVVYAYTHVDPTQEQAASVRLAAENLLQPVADGMARLLGVKPGVLPISDSTIPWYASKADVYVEASRDGRVTYHTYSNGSTTAAERFIELAIDSAVAHENGPLVVNPDGTPPPDRAHFHILTGHAATGVEGYSFPMAYEGAAVPLFATRFPSSTQVDGPMDFVPPQFPKDSTLSYVDGRVIERFLVDTNGRAVPSSIRDVWPHGVSRLTGDESNYWDEFVSAVHNWLKEAHFKPATIGGCPVPQMAQEPFEFHIAR